MQHLFKANQTNKKIQPCKIHPLPLVLLLFGMMLLLPETASAQELERLWYIANDKALENEPTFDYNNSTPEQRYYIVPAKDPALTDLSDAYFSEDYTVSYGDPEKPFLTTYKTNRDVNSAWVIKSDGDGKFYLIHVLTGKYAVYQTTPDCTAKPHRKVIHLETLTVPENDNRTRFYIENGTTTYTFRPQSLSSGNRYFNPSGGNKDFYNAQGGDCNNTGLIGVYSDPSNRGSKWHLEAALLTAPTISEVDPNTNTVTVTEVNGLPPGYDIRYEVSTNGNPPENPTDTSRIMEGGRYFVESPCIIKAVVERYGIVLTNVATSGTLQPAVPNTPTFTVTCDNKLELSCANMANAHIYYTVSTNGTPPDDPDNTSDPYTGAITLNAGDIVKAIAYNLNETLSSSIGTYTHQIVNTEAPELVVTSSTIVTITGPAGSTIYYTTNGVDPEIGASGVISQPSPVEVDYGGNMMDIRAIAQVGSLGPSCVAGLVTMGKPIVNIETDDCSETAPRGNVIVIPLPSDGSTIWYAVTAGDNSTAPEINAIPNPYTQYTGEVSLDDLDGSNAYYTVHAYAKSSDGSSTSAIETVSHQMKTGGKPELTPPVGSNPVVLISGGVYGDVAVCSAGGVTTTVPITSEGTAEYTIPAAATGNLVVTFRHGVWPESLCSATYEIPDAPEAPTWSQECDNRLSLSTTSPMAVIHYEIGDNDNPPAEPSSSSNTYTEGCLYNIEVGTIVRAKAFEGFRASEEMLADPDDPSSGYYVHHHTHVAAPTFFVNGTEVTIRCATSGASIYYTVSTNGNNNEDDPIPDPADPDPSDPTQLYTTEYNLTGITKIKAIAVKDGMENSCPILVTTREGYSITNVGELNSISGDENKRSKYWFIENDFDASDYNGPVNFTGVVVGNYHTISGLTKPLFNETSGSAVVHGLNLKEVNIPAGTEGNVGSIVCTAKENTRIYNCGILPTTADGLSTSQVGGTGIVGGLVGVLQDNARVINCYSYADITSGTYRGGIVGYNTGTSTQAAVTTMIMNCMFYGDISTLYEPEQIAPVYGGVKISNSGNTGLNNFNYFRFNSPYVSSGATLTYNCALGAKDRNLERFEFYRLTLNSNHELASWYIKGTVTGASERVGQWVIDKNVAPYPTIKTGEGFYPSIINPDAEHAIPIDPDNEHRNEGRKLGELTVKITAASGWTNKPTGAGLKDPSYATTGLTINITDKDEANYNFNYKKVQLPYYNDIGTNNYTGNKVVTGWKITAFDHEGTGCFCTDTYDDPCYNFVDRTCTDKDKYSVSGRVFNQGAYYEVPDGVTQITIEPYWANCVYLSDSKYDVTYNNKTACPVNTMGSRPNTFNGSQTVYNAIATAISNLTAGATVYDAAVVLVGNYHHFFDETSINPNNDNGKPLTIMSADMDNDNEPDNSFFYQHYDRRAVKPLRFDFINIPGIGMAQKEDGREYDPQPGIFHATGWFEITNTVLISFGQFEFAKSSTNTIKPIILHGGIYEQYVSTNDGDATYQYMFVGGNAWFKEFNVGCHTRTGAGKTPKHPVSVAGGDFEKFYLSGRNKPEQTQDEENAECYIDGGRFGEVAGACMQQIRGDVTWLINGADITSFFGGGVNYDKPITGTISTTISNSWVDEFCGGPKFGNMASGKAVTTEATNCHFGTFFGAGYGGTAFNRKGLEDASNQNNYDDKWNSWVDTHYKRAYNSTYSGVSTSYEYEYFFYSGGRDAKKVGRFYVNFASLSLASTQNVNSTLTGCTIGNFYGGGKLGSVNGNVVSTLTDCTVTGDVFGSGYSAAVPTVEVTNRKNSNNDVGFETKPYYDKTANVFNDEQVSPPVPPVVYTWNNDASNFNLPTSYFNEERHLIYTNQAIDNLGAVLGNATLTINGNSVVMGDVYGGGAKSSSNTNGGTAKIEVNINGGTFGDAESGTGGNIYGGGMGDADNAVTEGIVEVNIGNSTQSANNVVIHGSVYGCNNVNGSPKDNVTVNVYKTKHDGSNVVAGSGFAIANVFGGGNQAHYEPTTAGKMTTVHIHNCDNTIEYVYGGGNAANVGSSTTSSAAEVIIDGGHIGWVFGGGNGAGEDNPGANIFGNATVTYHAGLIDHLFGGSNEKGSISGTKTVSVLGDGSCAPMEIVELYGGNNKADAAGDISLTMACSNSSCKVDYLFGGSRMANISGNVELNVYGGEYDYVFGGNNLSGTITGDVTLNLYGGTINEAAFGGNKGGYDEGSVFHDGGTILGDITVNVEDQNLECPLEVNHVFGAGDLAIYTAPTGTGAREFNPMVNIKHIRTGQSITGNVYGGGNGNPEDSSQEPGRVTGNPKVTIGDITAGHESYIANINGNVFGGGNAAKVVGNTTVLMQKANSTVGQDIFGGGNLAMVTGATDVDIDNGTVTGSVFGGGNQAGVSTTDVAMTGGTVLSGIYGGCNTSGIVNGNISVGITGGTIGAANSHAVVHGGGFGNGTSTTGNVNVTVNGAGVNIWGDVYGGSAKGHVNDASSNQTNVTLTSGTLHGDLYGGGLGDNENAALVKGAVQVTVNGGTVTGSVYGCNNVNGAPQSTVKVDIYGTDTPASGYALNAVFGGGNAAPYGGTPDVTIHNCDNSIGFVYGGGNAASVASTNVVVYGGNTIGYVFGGGNGQGVAADYTMVSGNAVANIHGGTISHVFGGNNSSGAISGNITVNVNKQTETGHASCPMKIGEVYGGGNMAAGNAGTINIGCTGDLVALGTGEHYGIDQEGIQYVYGGANQANINNNIVLNINSGIVENVFGGNNTSGAISGTIQVNIEKNDDATCAWYVGDVYGGGNLAPYTGSPAVNIKNGTVSQKVYGGGKGSTAVVTGNPLVTVGDNTNANYSAIVLGDVYGGGDAAAVTGNTSVTYYDTNATSTVAKLFGGGNAAGVTGTATVALTQGTVTTGVYGGCNSSGNVGGKITVNVTGGTLGSQTNLNSYTTADVFGGGFGASTSTSGNVEVNINGSGVNIYGDVYGGSALGDVNTGVGNTTIVNILDGTLHSVTDNSTGFPVYHGGNVYGGGLGDATHAPVENGIVIVNIGTGTPNPFTVLPTGVSGDATIGGNVYGCNNTAGSPQDNVFVNVFKTAHTEGPDGNSTEGTGYAIANVFGGGNEADYAPSASGKKATVNVYTCDNTIRRVFGGGNAASAPEVETNIQGGHIQQVFGGGNGERGPAYAADINGHVYLNIHGGNVEQFFGGSNQNGHIDGSIYTDVTSDGPCGGMVINEFFCGSNEVDITGNVITTMTCSENMTVTNLYGGCNQANITGNVVLNIEGGTYTNVFGGSKGRLSGTNSPEDPGKSADITGNVTLNLKGGTIENAFGGSNVNGNIGGTITVNVVDVEDPDCPLYVTNIYGGSNLTDYEPTYTPDPAPERISPVVNVIHIKHAIRGNVYGGSKGEVGSGTELHASPLVNIGYDAATMSGYVPAGYTVPSSPRAIVAGNVFGGGDAATVNGNTAIFLRNRAKVFGNVYGGGNMGVVTGDTKVIVNGDNQ